MVWKHNVHNPQQPQRTSCVQSQLVCTSPQRVSDRVQCVLSQEGVPARRKVALARSVETMRLAARHGELGCHHAPSLPGRQPHAGAQRWLAATRERRAACQGLRLECTVPAHGAELPPSASEQPLQSSCGHAFSTHGARGVTSKAEERATGCSLCTRRCQYTMNNHGNERSTAALTLLLQYSLSA